MTAVIIIACVLLVLFIIAILPITFRFEFEDDYRIRLSYAKIPLYDSSKGKKGTANSADGKKIKKASQKSAGQIIKNEFSRLGVKDFIETYSPIVKQALGELLWAVKKLRFKIFVFELSVASDNAFDTAIEYGTVCAALYPIFSVLCGNAKIKVKSISISSDFVNTSYGFKADVNVSLNLAYTVAAAVKLYKIYLKFKEKQDIIKDGENK